MRLTVNKLLPTGNGILPRLAGRLLHTDPELLNRLHEADRASDQAYGLTGWGTGRHDSNMACGGLRRRPNKDDTIVPVNPRVTRSGAITIKTMDATRHEASFDQTFDIV